MFKYKSKVGIANPKSNSLRAGIPKEVVNFLGIKSSDSLIWEVNIIDSENIEVHIKKAV